MNYREILKSWRRSRGRSQNDADGVQGAISLACLRGWWRTGQATQPHRQSEERKQVRPLTPWSHGLF